MSPTLEFLLAKYGVKEPHELADTILLDLFAIKPDDPELVSVPAVERLEDLCEVWSCTDLVLYGIE